MPDQTAAKLVAEIKTLYSRRLADKLVMQKNMVKLRDKYGWTIRKIADETGVPKSTVDRWVLAHDSGKGLSHMGQALTPENDRSRSDGAVAKRVFETAPMEQVEQILSELPKERQEKIAAATGDPYFQAKHQELDRRKQQTDAERAQEEADKAAMKQPYIDFSAELSAESVGGLLTHATETLQRMGEQGLLTVKAMRLIEVYDEQWRKALDWARELSGEDGL